MTGLTLTIPVNPERYSLHTIDDVASRFNNSLHAQFEDLYRMNPKKFDGVIGNHLRRQLSLISKHNPQEAMLVERELKKQPRLVWLIEEFFKDIVGVSPETYDHVMHVTVLTAMLAKKLQGESCVVDKKYKLTDDEVSKLLIATMLHDHGKLWIPDEVLHSGAKLSDTELDNVMRRIDITRLNDESKSAMRKVAMSMNSLVAPPDMTELQFRHAQNYLMLTFCEDGHMLLSEKEANALRRYSGKFSPHNWEIMKRHAQYTWDVLSDSRLNLPEHLADLPQIAAYHHENMDGSGYPFGKKGDDIPPATLIMEVADKFEAMTADRSYQKGKHVQDAVNILRTLASEGKMDASLIEASTETLKAFARLKPREYFPESQNTVNRS